MPDLTIDQIRTAKLKMEAAIDQAAAKAVNEFTEATSLCVDSLHVRLVRIERIGQQPFTTVERTEATIDLRL